MRIRSPGRASTSSSPRRSRTSPADAASRGGRDAGPLVKRVDRRRVLPLDRAPLELEGGRELVARGLPGGVEDAEPLDLLRPAEPRIRAVDRGRDLRVVA